MNDTQHKADDLKGTFPGAEGTAPDFSTVRISTHVTRIYDRLIDVQMYLVEGRDRALLIDTGFGIGDLAALVKGLTDKPVTVVVTHGHIDHAFGAGWFDDVYMSHADLEMLDTQLEWLGSIQEEARNEGRVIAPSVDPSLLKDIEPDQEFDLGGLTVRTIPFPGHSPGMHVLLIVEDRVLITGDAANQRTFLFIPGASTITEYRRELARVAEATAGLYDRIYISHATGNAPITLFQDLDALCERIQNRTDDATPFEIAGQHALMARQPLVGIEDAGSNIVYRSDRI
ncbi:MBL fold metallo-hydrolase [Micrococcaceae bacterium Sec5.1]